jgi:hypothetical protein
LLEPAESEIRHLRALQRDLQRQFGGRPQERVHLTCQRFDAQDEATLRRFKATLHAELAAMEPPRIVATSAFLLTHEFWQMTLLRWEIEQTGTLRDLLQRLETVCLAAGITPHYPASSGWMPSNLTALEAIDGATSQADINKLSFRHYLFTASHLTLSRIVAPRQFQILGTVLFYTQSSTLQ